MFVRVVKEDTVTNLNELKMKSKVVKHVECSEINSNISNYTQVEAIPD